jgi:hypothetical protein
MLIEQLPVSARETTQVGHPVVRGRLSREAPEDPVQQRVDELLLGREVGVERHRGGVQVRGDGAQGQGVEAVLGHLPRWIGVSGALLALGIATGLGEPAGWELGGTINSYSYLVWAVWLIAVGVTLLVRRGQPARAALRTPLVGQSAVR